MAVRKRAICSILALAMMIAPAAAMPAGAVEPATLYVEQVDVTMPEFNVRFQLYNSDLKITLFNPADISATLDGKPLTLDSVSHYTEGTLFMFLADISGSIRADQNAAMKTALKNFHAELGPNDRMALAAFGNEVTVMLSGSETNEEANAIIDTLSGNDQTTHFYDAISVARAIAENKVSGLPDRCVVFVISDGLDDTEGGGHTSREVAELLKQSGLPLWALGLSGGNSSPAEKAALDAFGELARNSGGGYVTVTAATLESGITSFYDYLQGVQTARFYGENNIVDLQEHMFEFSVRYFGAVISSQIPVTPMTWIEDNDPPQVVGFPEQTGDFTLSVAFSELMNGADIKDNYLITNSRGEAIPLLSVEYDQVANTATITFDGQPYIGEYVLRFSGITDVSMEQNPLVGDYAFHFEGQPEPPPSPQPVTPPSPAPPEPEEHSFIYVIFVDYWWVVLLFGLVVAAVIIWLVIYNTIKKRKGLVMVDGVIGFGDAVEFKHHFETPESKRASLVVTDMTGKAQRVELDIYGSFFVGRSEQQNNLSFNDEKMSRQHFVIEANEDGFFLTDLNSTNGTNINGVPVSGRRRLNENDVITAGHEKFVFTGAL